MTLALHSSVEFRDMDIPGRRLVVARVKPEGEGTSWFLSVFDEDVTCALATFSLSLEDGEKLREAIAPTGSGWDGWWRCEEDDNFNPPYQYGCSECNRPRHAPSHMETEPSK